jgi:hypothetical protein
MESNPGDDDTKPSKVAGQPVVRIIKRYKLRQSDRSSDTLANWVNFQRTGDRKKDDKFALVDQAYAQFIAAQSAVRKT